MQLKKRCYNGSLILAISVCLIYRLGLLLKDWPSRYLHDDFNHYYATAWLTLQGKIPYGIPFETTALNGQFIWHQWTLEAANPPALTLATIWLPLLPPQASWSLWSLVLSSCLLGTWWCLCKAFQWSWKEKAFSLAMFLGSLPLVAILAHGQIQAVILLLVVSGWYSFRMGGKALPGILWGTAAGLKIYAWPLVLFCLLSGNRKQAICAIGSAGIIFLLPAALFGSEVYIGFYQIAIPHLQSSAISLAHNVSFGRTLYEAAHIFGETSKQTIFLLLYLLPALLAAGVTSYCARRATSTRDADFAVASIATLAFLCSPVAWGNYLIVLVLPWAVLYHYSESKQFTLGTLFLLWVVLFQKPHPSSELSFYSSDLFYHLQRGLILASVLLLFSWFWRLRKIGKKIIEL